MLKNIVGVFNPGNAEQVRAALLAKGFPESDIHVTAGNQGAEDVEDGIMGEADAHSHHESGIVHFFKDLFGLEDEHDSHRYASSYSDAVKRGNSVVAVTVDSEDEVDRVEDIMSSYHAINIDEEDSDETDDSRDASWNYAGSIPDNDADLRSARNLSTSERSSTDTPMGGLMSDDTDAADRMARSSTLDDASTRDRSLTGRSMSDSTMNMASDQRMGESRSWSEQNAQRMDSSGNAMGGMSGNSGRSLTDSGESLTDKVGDKMADAGRAIKNAFTGDRSSTDDSLDQTRMRSDNLSGERISGTGFTGSEVSRNDLGRDDLNRSDTSGTAMSGRGSSILGGPTEREAAGSDGYLSDEESIRASKRTDSSVDLTRGPVDDDDTRSRSSYSGESMTDKVADKLSDAGNAIKNAFTGNRDSSDMTSGDTRLRSDRPLSGSDTSLTGSDRPISGSAWNDNNAGQNAGSSLTGGTGSSVGTGSSMDTGTRSAAWNAGQPVQRGNVRIFTRNSPFEREIRYGQPAATNQGSTMAPSDTEAMRNVSSTSNPGMDSDAGILRDENDRPLKP